MKKSICVQARNCFAFNDCSNNDFQTCGGKVGNLKNGNRKYNSLLPQFHIGKCTHCGLHGKVAEVNSKFNKACPSCWQPVLQVRTLEELIKEREKRRNQEKKNKKKYQKRSFFTTLKMAQG